MNIKKEIPENTLGWLLDPDRIKLRNQRRTIRTLFIILILLTTILFVI